MIRVHSIETLGALDGPGIRTVVFFQGCPARCWYCHNADTFDAGGGKVTSEEEIRDFCARYKSYYGSEGGVTLSGGEPLLQANGALKLIQLLKSEGIHTALDTSGMIFEQEVLKEADLVILDIKHTNADKFKELTGIDISETLKTLQYLKDNSIKFWIRQVILPGFNDTVAQIQELKKMAEGAEKIELLPYHSSGAYKWEKLGLEYKLKNVEPPSVSKMEQLKAALKG